MPGFFNNSKKTWNIKEDNILLEIFLVGLSLGLIPGIGRYLILGLYPGLGLGLGLDLGLGLCLGLCIGLGLNLGCYLG